MDKLRLLVTDKCNRDCPMCCNKNYDLTTLKVEEDYSKYNEVFLTGGEPMLNPFKTFSIIKKIKDSSKAKVYMYTAKVDNDHVSSIALNNLDGMTLTLHDQEDVLPFMKFTRRIVKSGLVEGKSLRLNIFDGVKVPLPWLKVWKVKAMEWVEDCPIPEGEVFRRYGDN